MYELDPSLVEAPPQTVRGILRRLGPGLIIAGSIVGSGELIATPKTGAEAGFWLLWLIIIGCVIKLFAQVELGRYTISSGKTTMAALNEMPGRLLGANWILWYWLAMFIVSLAQLGGIVGGVGQSLAMTVPLTRTGDFNQLLKEQQAWDEQARPICQRLPEEDIAALTSRDAQVRRAAQQRIKTQLAKQIGQPRPERRTWDDKYWAAIVTAVTIVLLVVGRYRLIQNFSVLLVASFTAVTVIAVFGLQLTADYAVTWADLGKGLSFRLPKGQEMIRVPLALVQGDALSPLATALATFGIIGVGATELISYPYWCLEKGYAQFTGRCQQTPQWVQRARGWLRVMRWDACVSMVIFTFATVAFYILGAAVLHREGLDPEKNQMIRALSRPYEEVFGPWAWWLFLFGAFAVLYSTFFVATAGHARVVADALRVLGISTPTERARQWWVKVFCTLFPLISLTFFVLIPAPAKLVLASGVMQAIMLPMLGGATLYFRYRRCDPRITPGKLWDVLLWLSAFGLLLAGGWLALTKLFPALEQLGMR